MKCPKCDHDDTRVIESRDVSEGESVRRRRECIKCQHRYTTYERLERPHLVVVKNDGTRQLFNREKLMTGLMRATEKTPVTAVQVEDLVARVEKNLYETGEGEIDSSTIGQYVMAELAELNDVAYIRFASVYRRFTSLDSFERELGLLREKPKEKPKAESQKAGKSKPKAKTKAKK